MSSDAARLAEVVVNLELLKIAGVVPPQDADSSSRDEAREPAATSDDGRKE